MQQQSDCTRQYLRVDPKVVAIPMFAVVLGDWQLVKVGTVRLPRRRLVEAQ